MDFQPKTPKRVRFADQPESNPKGESADSISTRPSSQRGIDVPRETSIRTLTPFPSLGREDEGDIKSQSCGQDPYESSARGMQSLAIVPYSGGGAAGQPPCHHLFALLEECSGSHAQVLRDAALPHGSFGGLPTNTRLEKGNGLPAGSGTQLGPVLSPLNVEGGKEHYQSKWMIVSKEQVEQTAKKMRDQAEKNKALETTVKSHKRERVLIYDAAMKQAAKRELEGVDEVKQVLERQQGMMRAEVDQEMRKISDLYQERCRDYARMVSDECDGEDSKAVTDLRKDWARQKKTIDQLVRSSREEDRQVSAIARAVVEQLQEERSDEIASLRAAIYSDVKMEFESREVALRDTLESDFQADLDGQLLLAEIRHQKEMNRLRVELAGSEKPTTEAKTSEIIVYNPETLQCAGSGQRSSGASSFTASPSFSRRHLHKMNIGEASGGNSGAGGVHVPTTPRGTQLGRKFPVFKTPVQKKIPGIGNKKAVRPKGHPVSDSTRKSRNSSAGRHTKISTITPIREHEDYLDVGITSALMVSPTKAIHGVVTPSIGSEGGVSGEGSSRPKKRAKKLFSSG
ncbi:unnamed protein product [Ectocarpus sp. CCAP 1310/34]|nr:unnamed protein product [Ectocarpus sp. CCAP 1310/34]